MTKLLTQCAVKGRQEISDSKRVAIAAIDFGTTFCSLAYSLSDDDKVNLIELNPHQQRVPTAILLRKQGLATDGTQQLVIHKFGFDAQHRTIALTEEERPDHVYFELVKMLLYSDNQVTAVHVHVYVRWERFDEHFKEKYEWRYRWF